MEKLKFSYFIFLFFCQPCLGQQFPLFTQYREHQTLINPAATSNNYITKAYTLNFGSSIRYQWTAVDGAPKLNLFQANATMLPNKGKVNWTLGGTFYNYATDPFFNQGIYLRTALLISDRPSDRGIAAGFSFGVLQSRVDPSHLEFRSPFDPIQDLGPQNQSILDGAAGVFGYTRLKDDNKDILYGGVSIPQIGYWLNYNNNEERELGFPVFYTLGWYRNLSDKNYLESSLWFRQFNRIKSIDLNLRYQIKNAFWLGTGIGLLDNQHFHMEAGVILQDKLNLSNLIRIGYGYDILSGPFSKLFGSTHEINLSLSFDLKPTPKTLFN